MTLSQAPRLKEMSVQNRRTLQKISRGLRSRYPIFYVLGWEEERIERLLRSVAKSYYSADDRLIVWTTTKGFSQPVDSSVPTEEGESTKQAALVTDPLEALQQIAESDQQAMYLMKDLPIWFENNPALVRAVRDLYYRT